MTPAAISLHPFTRADVETVAPWFRDPETRRFLGGPDWPAAMLDRGERAVGETFRGAVQLAADRYLAHAGGRAVGYVDCGTFDRCTVYGGEGPSGPTITETTCVATGSIGFVIDPRLRGGGLGRALIAALMSRPELRAVELFEAGVEPENIASRRCLEHAGFRPRVQQPDFEGMLYYRAWRREAHATVRPSR